MAGDEWYYDTNSGSVKKRNNKTKGSGKTSQGTLRSNEFANTKLQEYELFAPTRAPGDTTNASQLGKDSINKPSGGGGANYKSMLGALQKLAAMSQQGINSSMDSLLGTLQAQKNPFENFQAAQTQTTPDFTKLLQSQGVSTDPLQQFASAINTQNAGQATAFQNLADTLSGFNVANQQGMISDVGQQRSDLLNALQGNVFGTGAKLMGKKAPDRNAIVQMLLQSLKNRA